MTNNLIDKFTQRVIALNPEYTDLDYYYIFNQVVALIGTNTVNDEVTADLLTLVDKLIAAAIAHHQIADKQQARLILNAQLFDLITPTPHQVNEIFWQKYQQSPQQATNYFYQLCCQNNYIQTRALSKNEVFTVSTAIGDLEITINLAKPEKDPHMIAQVAHQVTTDYPLCKLCMANEGYYGNNDYPARRNLRIIRMNINDQLWGFQYSPYGYFREHAIFLTNQHIPMQINKQTYANLLAIVQQFPYYFVGSNADLPIVGGSVLAHQHYQGGRHIFPMMKAPLWQTISLPFKDVKMGLVKWPLATIRLQSNNITQLVTVAASIQQVWQNYNDANVHVYAKLDKQQHHTITPIAYYRSHQYVLDLVLRDNHVSARYPDGEFHVHPQYYHLKKENIGLIEVMGRAILPGRLQSELQTVMQFLHGDQVTVAPQHQHWAQQLQRQYGLVSLSQARDVVHQELGNTFAKILANTSVFKQNKTGRQAFLRFINYWKYTLN